MNYKDLIKDYHAKGFASEKRMWEAVQAIDGAMACLKEKSPEVYDRSMRALHVSFCGPHYNEAFACEDVSCLFHKNRKGETVKGEHWNMEQVSNAVKGYPIPGNATPYDIYVALNAHWHDKEVKFSEWFPEDHEKRIIEDAISFYFNDPDAPEGKIWIYMEAMKG